MAPAILMLDWEMPGLDGLSLAHHLTANEKVDPPYIIMLTARDANHDIISGLAAGANDYITKPYEPEILKARVAVARRTIELQERLASALRDLEVLASIDELTKLPNRRTVINHLETELTRHHRESSAICIGICDIDYFKNVNDSYGHSYGDAALKQTADILRQSFRPYDIVGRYGGEEFIFAINAEKPHVSYILERLRSEVEQHLYLFREQQFSLTLSIGAIMVDTEV